MSWTIKSKCVKMHTYHHVEDGLVHFRYWVVLQPSDSSHNQLAIILRLFTPGRYSVWGLGCVMMSDMTSSASADSVQEKAASHESMAKRRIVTCKKYYEVLVLHIIIWNCQNYGWTFWISFNLHAIIMKKMKTTFTKHVLNL